MTENPVTQLTEVEQIRCRAASEINKSDNFTEHEVEKFKVF